MVPQIYATFPIRVFQNLGPFCFDQWTGPGTFDEIYGNKCVLVPRRYTLPFLNPQITFQIYFTKYTQVLSLIYFRTTKMGLGQD